MQAAVVVEGVLRVVRQAARDLPVGAVQQRGARRQVLARSLGQAQGRQNGGLGEAELSGRSQCADYSVAGIGEL